LLHLIGSIGKNVVFQDHCSRYSDRVLGQTANRLGLSLLTLLALAWLSAALVPFGSSAQSVVERGVGTHGWWQVSRQETAGGIRFTSIVMPRPLVHLDTRQTQPLPAWADIPEPTGGGAGDTYRIVEAHGWPMPALAYRFEGEGGGAASTGVIHGGIALSPRATGAWYDPRALPLTPIWSGLFMDAALLTLAWSAMLDGAPATRRWLRRRRGLCPSCAYDLTGNTSGACPECGTPR
jgi:hypothetical protein